jgi:hypothetical protein
MFKLAAALILSLSSVATVVYVAPPSFWYGDRDAKGHSFWHGGDHDWKGHSFAAPEIDASSAMGALTLLLGSVVVLRSRVATKK